MSTSFIKLFLYWVSVIATIVTWHYAVKPGLVGDNETSPTNRIITSLTWPLVIGVTILFLFFTFKSVATGEPVVPPAPRPRPLVPADDAVESR